MQRFQTTADGAAKTDPHLTFEHRLLREILDADAPIILRERLAALDRDGGSRRAS